MVISERLHLHVGAREEEIRDPERKILATGAEQQYEIRIVAKVQVLGWGDGKRLTRCWVEKEEESS